MSEFNVEKLVGGIFSNAKKITKKVSIKANEAVESAKINFAISDTERKISECKEKIGDIVYREYVKSKDFEGDIGELCRMIENLNDDIEVMKDKMAEVKNSRRCQRCGTFNDDRNSFCSECGETLDFEEDTDGEDEFNE